jgi:DnaJ-class molecular chaperone
MKKFIFSILTIASLGLTACGGDHQQKHSDSTGKEFTSAYVCPMHCEGSGSDQAGTCPACGMEYVTQAEHVKDGHAH